MAKTIPDRSPEASVAQEVPYGSATATAPSARSNVISALRAVCRKLLLCSVGGSRMKRGVPVRRLG
jgi:hypothetical protein